MFEVSDIVQWLCKLATKLNVSLNVVFQKVKQENQLGQASLWSPHHIFYQSTLGMLGNLWYSQTERYVWLSSIQVVFLFHDKGTHCLQSQHYEVQLCLQETWVSECLQTELCLLFCLCFSFLTTHLSLDIYSVINVFATCISPLLFPATACQKYLNAWSWPSEIRRWKYPKKETG